MYIYVKISLYNVFKRNEGIHWQNQYPLTKSQ